MKNFFFIFISLFLIVISSCSSNRRVVRALTPYEIVALKNATIQSTPIVETNINIVPQNQNTENSSTVNNQSNNNTTQEEESVVIETIKDSNNDNNEIIDKKINDIWEIRLEENPTTGFVWSYKTYGDSCVEIIDDSFITSQNEDIVGALGIHRWYLKAKSKGIVTFAFSYSRPWQESSEISRRVYTYIVSE